MTDSEMIEQFQIVVDSVQKMIEDSEHRMKVYMELKLEKRLDSLFDGYKLTHEKQWELEHETRQLKEQIDSLETLLAVLEKKLSA